VAILAVDHRPIAGLVRHRLRLDTPVDRCDSACALELARRGAGRSGSGHAGFAYINTLAEVSCIEFFVPLGDASTLLIRIFNFLRARRQKDSERRHYNDASRLHSAAFGRMTSHKDCSPVICLPATAHQRPCRPSLLGILRQRLQGRDEWRLGC
jgi:hypothetical protein